MDDGPQTTYQVEGRVDVFDRPGGWYFIAVPQWISDELAPLADRGLIAIRAAIGTTSWDTSLLPMGDGTHFVALNKAVRDRNDLTDGSNVTIVFSTRRR